MKKKLYEPFQLGKIKLRNRLVMSAMNENMSTHEGAPTEYQLAYYEKRAQGGVGMIITGNAFIDEEASQITSGQMGIYTHRFVPTYARLVDRIHLAGAAIIMQLSHAGRQTFLPWQRPLLAPSAIPCLVVGETPKEMDKQDIAKLIDNFAHGALRAKMASFDGVEIHCGHGYLLSQFISPHSNKRTDEYGGSLENRIRLPLQVIKRTRELVGPEFIVGVKFNAREALPEGIKVEEGSKIAKIFENIGVDYLNVTAGTYETGDEQCQCSHLSRGYNTDLAARIKQEVSIPVITVGSINDPHLAEELVETGKTDLVAMGRTLIADPEFPRKAAAGNYEDIRMCLRCNECQGRLVVNKQIICTLNPKVGVEGKYLDSISLEKKHIVILGGGPAGLEAARVAALKGHQVTLIEKSERLGGVCLPLKNPDFKKELENIPRFYEVQLKKLGVNIQLRREGTVEYIKKLAPDVVIVATGGISKKLNVPCEDGPAVFHAIDYLNGEIKLGNTVAVVGAGLVGLETALTLSAAGKDIKVIEVRPENEIGSEINALAAYRLLSEVKQAGIEIIAGQEVISLVNGISLRNVVTKEETRLEVDNILLAVGIEPQISLIEKLNKEGMQVYGLGDTIKPSTIRMAITSAHELARKL
ncbi:MAG: hypothetical protein JM58_08165 [Peptococcaceae bacterium BICA1-8]|nr:MAG: hypothetical protein JM58_08165 [Peptococcaceae bacterium BICA1-8]